MPINFIVNDPAVSGTQAQQVDAMPEAAVGRVGFLVTNLPAESVYPAGSVEFVAWQAREAALRALTTFEDIAGPLPGWAGSAKKKVLKLHPNLGEDLNAYYDRQSLAFWHFKLGAKTIFSGASTDVVAHETGHAILDALRPQLWSTAMFEVDAFHEGFGDCIALMVALSDNATRVAILQNDPNLQNGNFVEATAEELSAGIRSAAGPNHNAAAPRRALNAFQWTLPGGLPNDGKPGVLIEEIHSYGQVTSGCYYDLIREIFRAGQPGEAALWQACQAATALLAEAVTIAPIRPRFLESVGRTMILVDRKRNPLPDGTGRNEGFIRTAFGRHGIALSVSTYFTPRALLEKGKPRKKRGRATDSDNHGVIRLAASIQAELRSVLDVAEDARIETRAFALGETMAAHVVVQRPVDLTGLAEGLADVKAYALRKL